MPLGIDLNNPEYPEDNRRYQTSAQPGPNETAQSIPTVSNWDTQQPATPQPSQHPQHEQRPRKRRAGLIVGGLLLSTTGAGLAGAYVGGYFNAKSPVPSPSDEPSIAVSSAMPSESPTPSAIETPSQSPTPTLTPTPTPSLTPTPSASTSETSSPSATPSETTSADPALPPTAKPSGTEAWIGASTKTENGQIVPLVVCAPASQSEIVTFSRNDIGSDPNVPVPVIALQNQLGNKTLNGFNYRSSMVPKEVAEQFWTNVQVQLNAGRIITKSFSEKPFWAPIGCDATDSLKAMNGTSSEPSASASVATKLPKPPTTAPSTAEPGR